MSDALNTLSRRRFLQLSGAGAIGLSTGSLILPTEALAETPKKGGHLRIATASGSTSDTLDPAHTDSNFMQVLNAATRNRLTEITHEGKLIPELATSWEADASVKTWTFKLREGITFSDGRPFNAQSAIASINHHRGEGSSSAVKQQLDIIKELKADGDYTLVFTLNAGSADFPYLMNDYHVVMMPEKDGQADWQSGIGTAGYVLDQFEPGVRATVKRRDGYWKEGRAHFDSAELMAIADVNARTNALNTGQVDVINRCDLKTVHLLKRNKKIDITNVTGKQHFTFPMNTTAAPYDNVDVRLALKYGLDREALVNTILRGYGSVANDHPISTAYAYHNDQLAQRAYDPDKAKFHLKKAGIDKLEVTLSAAEAAFPGAVDSAVLYQEHAKKAGIALQVERVANDGYWSNVWMKKPWCASYWGGRATEDEMFTVGYSKGASWNDSFWDNERFNQLLGMARSELDEAKRKEMYFEMQQLLSDEGGVVIPMFANYVGAVSKKVTYDTLSPDADFDGHLAIERWWFA